MVTFTDDEDIVLPTPEILMVLVMPVQLLSGILKLGVVLLLVSVFFTKFPREST